MAWVHPLFDTSGRLHTYTFYTTAIKGEATDAVIEFERKGIVIQPTSPSTKNTRAKCDSQYQPRFIFSFSPPMESESGPAACHIAITGQCYEVSYLCLEDFVQFQGPAAIENPELQD